MGGWVGNDDHRRISRVKWSKALSSFELGGLNIGSLKASNMALIGKWWWRFRVDPKALWVRNIKSVYGEDGGFKEAGLRNTGCSCTWGDIIRIGRDLEEKRDTFCWVVWKRSRGWSGNLVLVG